MGASGAGETYLANAFGIAAYCNYLTIKHIRHPAMLYELLFARGEGINRKVMKQYKKVRLLIHDECLLTSLNETQSRDMLDIFEVRHRSASTIFCSLFAPAGWHAKLGKDTLADAILDRTIRDSYTITIVGDASMRKRPE